MMALMADVDAGLITDMFIMSMMALIVDIRDVHDGPHDYGVHDINDVHDDYGIFGGLNDRDFLISVPYISMMSLITFKSVMFVTCLMACSDPDFQLSLGSKIISLFSNLN
jgi:hypothetical protein